MVAMVAGAGGKLTMSPNESSGELADLRRLVGELLAEVTALRAENAALKAENAALKLENAELRARLGMNSTNSSQPPSVDSPFKRPPPKPPTGKKPGGQRGHPGRFRRLAEAPTEIVVAAPCTCEHCGAGLGADDISGTPYIHEVVDIEIKHGVRHIQMWAGNCSTCGRRTRAKAPIGTPTGNFGPRLEAAIGMLTAQGVSRSDVQKIVDDLFDITMSTGAIDAVCTRVAESVEDAVEQVAEHVSDAGVAHADETGWHVRGKLGWLWGALTADAELFRFDARRNRDALAILVRGFGGVLHSDRWGPYKRFVAEMRQLCHAHLRRDMQALIDRGGLIGEIGKRLLGLSNTMFSIWHRFEAKAIDVDTLQAEMAPVQASWLTEAAALAARAEKGKALGKSMLQLWPALWNFLLYEGVVPTNNSMEQAIRKAVKIRKNTFGSTSDDGARRTASLLTVVGTARRQKARLMHFLIDALDRRNRGLPGPLLLPAPVPAATG